MTAYTIYGETNDIGLTHIKFGNDSLMYLFNKDEASKKYLEEKVSSEPEALRYMKKSNRKMSRQSYLKKIFFGSLASIILGIGTGIKISETTGTTIAGISFVSTFLMIGILPSNKKGIYSCNGTHSESCFPITYSNSCR